MTGSLGVMAVILLEAAVGGAVVLWAGGVHGAVRRGFFLLTGVVLSLCALGAWALSRSAVAAARAGGDAGGAALAGAPGSRMLVGLALFAGLMLAWQVVLALRDGVLAKAVGLVAAGSGVVALVLFGLARGHDVVYAVAELVLGSVFLGSALYGLLLGHWYMVERRLDKTHMIRSASWYAAGVAAAVLAVALSARNPAPDLTAVASPFLAVPGFSVLLGGGLVAVCALIAGFVWKLAREGGRSIQAATGMFYLAVIMAFSAEVAAKFRFF